MAKKDFGCGRPECCASSGIMEEVTFGTGHLNYYGYWEFPCKECKQSWIKEQKEEAMARFTVEVPDKHRANQVRQIRVVDAMLQQPPLATPDESIADASVKMLDAKLNTLPVVGEGNRLAGMISTTDFTRFVANKFKVPEASE